MQQEKNFDDEPRIKFPFGDINATPNVLRQIPNEEIVRALARHLAGGWGDLDADDLNANENALRKGGRLFSAYNSVRNIRFWIITEADRSYTTVLLPGDY
jgi:hypothetical protein